MEVQPIGDVLGVVFSDTTTVVSYSIPEDSIRSDETIYNLLGCYKDPVFGTSSASIVTQLRLTSNGYPYGAGANADSLILNLRYYGSYGDVRVPQTVRVYELNETLNVDSNYFSNRVYKLKPTELASFTFTPKPLDSIYADGGTYPATLRIPLSLSYAQEHLINSSPANYVDNTSFASFLKGICVTTVPVNSNDAFVPYVNKGAILYFDLLSAYTRLTLYYHNVTDDSLRCNFIVNNYCARINKFNHYQFADACVSLRNQVTLHDTMAGKQNVYLQSMSGVKTVIKFPYLKSYTSKGKVAINKAELILRVDNTDLTISEFDAPPKLALVKVNADGNYSFMLDQFEGDSYFGGNYDASKREYKFTITRHLQNILNNDVQDYGLMLMVSGGSIKANRVVFVGTDKLLSSRLRLNLTFTKVN